jgi:hypothetical protein
MRTCVRDADQSRARKEAVSVHRERPTDFAVFTIA